MYHWLETGQKKLSKYFWPFWNKNFKKSRKKCWKNIKRNIFPKLSRTWETNLTTIDRERLSLRSSICADWITSFAMWCIKIIKPRNYHTNFDCFHCCFQFASRDTLLGKLLLYVKLQHISKRSQTYLL